MKRASTAAMSIGGLVLLVLGILFGPGVLDRTGPAALPGSEVAADAAGAPERSAPSAASTTPRPAAEVDAAVGFTSRRSLDEHFEKHGREFGSISKDRYLRLAQELRDAPRGGPVREAARSDGVITRFDTRTGSFVAFHADRTIRTFFKPDDGLAYFERQIEKEHR